MSPNVIGIGEVLWDLLPQGRQLGGAPANFVFHARSLGLQAGLISCVGEDELGRALLRDLKSHGVTAQYIQRSSELPTGTVSVTLDGQGIPRYTIHEPVAWDGLCATEESLSAVRRAEAVCFGSLAQRSEPSRSALRQLVKATPRSAIRVFDVNLRKQFYSRETVEESLRTANVLKLNDSELPVIAGMFGFGGAPREQVVRLALQFNLQTLALTQGEEGSLLYQQGRWSERPAWPVRVVDTVGAGDAFTAALVAGLLMRKDLDELHALAGEVASFVCSGEGATPRLPDWLCVPFRATPDSGPEPLVHSAPTPPPTRPSARL